MAYPASLDSFTTNTDDVDDVFAIDMNAVQAGIVAIETELGTDPAGSLTDLKTRLAVSLSAAGLINFTASALLTISGGSITPTQNWHRIDTEGGASTDVLDTITAGADGQVLLLRPISGARKITVYVGGNINIGGGGASFTTVSDSDLLLFIYDANLVKWVGERFMSEAAVNSWSAEQLFLASVRNITNSYSGNVTLDATHHTVTIDASGGAVTVTLPSIASCVGRPYEVVKVDSSANAVTVATTGGQTINGAATKVLSAQYAGATFRAISSEWIIIP